MKYTLFLVLFALMTLAFALGGFASASDTALKAALEEGAKITLTIGDKVVPAVLYNTPPARDLMARLPVTVSLNRGPVDYCGGIDPVKYGEDDARTMYRSGDLAFWIPGRDFVIFLEDSKASSGSPDFIILGQVKADIKEIKDLGSTIKVTITLDK